MMTAADASDRFCSHHYCLWRSYKCYVINGLKWLNIGKGGIYFFDDGGFQAGLGSKLIKRIKTSSKLPKATQTS